MQILQCTGYFGHIEEEDTIEGTIEDTVEEDTGVLTYFVLPVSKSQCTRTNANLIQDHTFSTEIITNILQRSGLRNFVLGEKIPRQYFPHTRLRKNLILSTTRN